MKKEKVGPQCTPPMQSLLERPRPEEGYPYPDMDSYVVALKSRLFIPEAEKQRLHYTNEVRLSEWLPRVQLVDSAPPVCARIGRKGILLSSEMELPQEITKDTPINQVLQAHAIALAKLSYLRQEAPQATSWFRGEISQRQINNHVETILSSKPVRESGRLEKVSFKEVISGLKPGQARLALATSALVLTACTGGVKETIKTSPTEPIATEIAPTPAEQPSPIPTATEEADVTPEAEFGEVGFIPGVFPGMGGESWQFTDMLTESGGGTVDTGNIKEQGFTPLAEGGIVVTKLAEGENGSSFFLVPRLDQTQYVKPGGSVGVATFNPDLSEGLIHIYADGSDVVYRQPGVMTNFKDGSVPVLGREDATGDVWVLYVDTDGQVVRRAPAFFGPESQVEVVEGRVLVDGQPMQIDQSEGAWVPGAWYRENEEGKVEVFIRGKWEPVPTPEIEEGLEYQIKLENEQPVIKVDIGDFGVPNGFPVAEFREGEWQLISFSFIEEAEKIQEKALLDEAYYRNTEYKFDTGELFIYSYLEARPLGLDVSVSENGEVEVYGLFAERGGIFKTKIDLLSISSNTSLGFFLCEEVSLNQIIKVIELFRLYPVYENPVLIGNDSAREITIHPAFRSAKKGTDIEEACSYLGYAPGYVEGCIKVLGEEGIYQPNTLADIHQLVMEASIRPEIGIEEIDWWKDVPEVNPDLMVTLALRDEIMVGGWEP